MTWYHYYFFSEIWVTEMSDIIFIRLREWLFISQKKKKKKIRELNYTFYYTLEQRGYKEIGQGGTCHLMPSLKKKRDSSYSLKRIKLSLL